MTRMQFHRITAGTTVTELAGLLECSPQTLGRLEAGKGAPDNLRMKTVKALEEFFKEPITTLLSEAKLADSGPPMTPYPGPSTPPVGDPD